MTVKKKQAERSAATRERLIEVARPLFARKGFTKTSSEEIVKRAKLTRGALYHQFPNGKKDLFLAVFETVERELAEELMQAVTAADDAWDALGKGCEAFLDACVERDVQQIALIDGPAVLGWEKWREINLQYCFGIVIAGLEAVLDESIFAGQPTAPVAHLILGAIDEAAMLVVRSDDVVKTKTEVSATLKKLIAAMRAT